MPISAALYPYTIVPLYQCSMYLCTSVSLYRRGFAGMGASLLFGTMGDSIGRAWSGAGSSGGGSGNGGADSSIITEANAERLANALCRCSGEAWGQRIAQLIGVSVGCGL